jgi:hypothetical protein
MSQSSPYYQQVQQRWRELADTAAGIIPAAITLEPFPSEILAIKDDLEILARKVDALVAAYGAYVDANSTTLVDQSLFTDQLAGALEGNALYEIDQAADVARDDLMAAAS